MLVQGLGACRAGRGGRYDVNLWLHQRTAPGGRRAHLACLQGHRGATIPALPPPPLLSSSFPCFLFSFSLPFTEEHVLITLPKRILPRRWQLSSDQESWTVNCMRKQFRNSSPNSGEKKNQTMCFNGVWIVSTWRCLQFHVWVLSVGDLLCSKVTTEIAKGFKGKGQLIVLTHVFLSLINQVSFR